MRPSIGVLLGVFLFVVFGGAATLAAQPVSDTLRAADPDTCVLPSDADPVVLPQSRPALKSLVLACDWGVRKGPPKAWRESGADGRAQAHLREIPPFRVVGDSRSFEMSYWQNRPSFILAAPGVPLARSLAQPRGIRPLNRTMLAIPLLRWQRPAVLMGAHGSVAVNPSIVVGRRLTFMPDVFRGGRTFGIAVEMKIRLDQQPRSPVGAGLPAGIPIASRVRAVMDKSRY